MQLGAKNNSQKMRGYDQMSASDKKKLRKEQESGKLTEKQLAAQKEAKVSYDLDSAAFNTEGGTPSDELDLDAIDPLANPESFSIK